MPISKIILLILFAMILGSGNTGHTQDTTAAAPNPAPWNAFVLEAIKEMPAKGLYQANATAINNLGTALRMEKGRLVINAAVARPSFCSTATYLVFLKALDRWSLAQNTPFSREVLDSLLVNRQPDGIGVWGCWNANGPGTARLFYLLGLGRNFTDINKALPGDFMKVFWNENIGSLERGHSVVYLGHDRDNTGAEFITYWSSNQPDGYGVARIPATRVKRILFSRLENPSALTQGKTIGLKDSYLAEMLKRPGTPQEMAKMTGATSSP